MIDGQTSRDARPWGTRMLSPPPVWHFAKPNGVASYRLTNTIGTVSKLDVQIFVIRMCAEFPDQRVCRFS